jgi:hypothetical protein
MDDYDDSEYVLDFQRDFDFKLEKSNFQFFLEFRPDQGGVYYKKLEHKLSLSKKRALNKQDMIYEQNDRPGAISYKLREFNEAETERRRDLKAELLDDDMAEFAGGDEDEPADEFEF